MPRITFCEKGRSKFSILYDVKGRSAVVCVDRPESLYILLGIQHAMMLLLMPECIGVHGVTLLCQDQILLLSAPSGTGKTTLSHLLEQYADAIVINGDFALLHVEKDGHCIVEPSPFCGTSKRSLNQRVPLNRIIFLEQSPTNTWTSLSARQAIVRLSSNTFIPQWDAELHSMTHKHIQNIVNSLPTHAFAFAPQAEAAYMVMKSINIKEE